MRITDLEIEEKPFVFGGADSFYTFVFQLSLCGFKLFVLGVEGLMGLSGKHVGSWWVL